MAPPPTKIVFLGLNGTALLDLLRALAANVVLFGHATDLFGQKMRLPAGNIGVGLFFILSGFLITLSALGRLARPGPRFVPFMLDRAARIFTAYIPALLLVACANAALDLPRTGQEGTSTGPLALAGNLLLLQDYPLFQAAHRLIGDAPYIRPYNTAEPFWTIPLEFWIYAVFALAVFGLFARERLVAAITVPLAAVACPVAIWNAAAGGGNGLSLVWLAGAAAGYAWAGGWHRGARKRQAGVLVALMAAACLLGRGVKTGWNFQDIGMAACEALILLGVLAAVEGTRTLPAWLRGACAFFASYSYSLYLVQNTVLVALRPALAGLDGPVALAVALACAHAAAFALYWAFERHYRQAGAWLKRRAAAGPVPSALAG